MPHAAFDSLATAQKSLKNSKIIEELWSTVSLWLRLSDDPNDHHAYTDYTDYDDHKDDIDYNACNVYDDYNDYDDQVEYNA